MSAPGEDALNALREFLDFAPAWLEPQEPVHRGEMELYRLSLVNVGVVACVRYHGQCWITLADVARITQFRLAMFGRHLIVKVGVLKNKLTSLLRPLEASGDIFPVSLGSPFLQLLKTHDCIPTLKAQKVFAWFAVPFDQLFLDILEHDLRAEEAQRHGKPHPPPPTEAVASPATSVELSQLLLERDRQRQDDPGSESASTTTTAQSSLNRSVSRSLNSSTSSSTGGVEELGGTTEKRRYACGRPGCGRAYKRREHLARHDRTHTKDRPHRCDACEQAFSRLDNLNTHKRRHVGLVKGPIHAG